MSSGSIVVSKIRRKEISNAPYAIKFSEILSKHQIDNFPSAIGTQWYECWVFVMYFNSQSQRIQRLNSNCQKVVLKNTCKNS